VVENFRHIMVLILHILALIYLNWAIFESFHQIKKIIFIIVAKYSHLMLIEKIYK
jgi:hypothetical protein